MKYFRLYSFTVALVFLLTACFAANDTSETSDPASKSLKNFEPVPITLWHYYVGRNQQKIEDAVAEFNQTVGAEKGIIIDCIAKGTILELESAISDSAKGIINSDPMPDIFSSYPDKAIEIDNLGMIADLTPYFTAEERAAYIPDFLSDGLFEKDRLLILPIAKSTELLYVNATAWNAFSEATGTSVEALKTWEDILTVSEKYHIWTDAQTPNIVGDGKAMAGIDSIPNFIIIGSKQLGTDIIDGKEQHVLLELPVLRKIFDIYVSGTAMNYFYASGKFRSDNVKSGEIIAYSGSTSSASYFPTWVEKNAAQESIELLALPYPYFSGGSQISFQQGAGMCISKSTEEKQRAASLFLKWFTDKKQNINFAMNSGYLPVKRDTFESQEFADTLEQLRQGDANQKNLSLVYSIAFDQIANRHTYAVKPFTGSYTVRTILQSTLFDAAEAAKKAAETLKVQGFSHKKIKASLNLEQRFNDWVKNLEKHLSNNNINYQKVMAQ